MHRTSVIGQKQVAPLRQRHQLSDAGLAGPDQGAGFHTRGNLPPQRLFPPASDDDDPPTLTPDVLYQAICRFSKTIGEPSLGAAVDGPGIQPQDEFTAFDPGRRQTIRHLLLLEGLEIQSRRPRRIRDPQPPQHLHVVPNLVHRLGAIRHANRVREQHRPAVGRVAPSPSDPRQPRNQSRLERILEQDGQVEPIPPEPTRQMPSSRKAGVAPLCIIDHRGMDRRMPIEQLRDRRLGQHRNRHLGKDLVQGGQGRLAHHGVPDPVGYPH